MKFIVKAGNIQYIYIVTDNVHWQKEKCMAEFDYGKVKELTEKQEELLRFENFNSRVAYELGKFLTDRVYESGIELAIAIRTLNGTILYQHLTEKTNHINQNWMMRKFNTVSYFERSSLGVWALEGLSGEKVAVHGLSESEFVFCGGGFPIKLKTGEFVAVLTVSNLPHMEDHGFIVEALAEYLGVKDVPMIV